MEGCVGRDNLFWIITRFCLISYYITIEIPDENKEKTFETSISLWNVIIWIISTLQWSQLLNWWNWNNSDDEFIYKENVFILPYGRQINPELSLSFIIWFQMLFISIFFTFFNYVKAAEYFRFNNREVENIILWIWN